MAKTNHSDLAEKVSAFYRHDPGVHRRLALIVCDHPDEKPSDGFLETLARSTNKIIANNPAIRKWLESLPEDELGAAIWFTTHNFQPGFKEVFKYNQECILASQKDKEDFDRGVASIKKGMNVILALESLPPDMRHKLKACYDSLIPELDYLGEQRYDTKNLRASRGGWTVYAEAKLKAAESTKERFSVPLELKPADLLRIVKATYGELNLSDPLKSVQHFMANRKKR